MMSNKINDFKIGTASRPERLRFKGNPSLCKTLIAEKLQIDPELIKFEMPDGISGHGSSNVFVVRRKGKRHK